MRMRQVLEQPRWDPWHLYGLHQVGPACHFGYGRSVTTGPEARVVSAVIDDMLSMGFEPRDLRLEYRLSPHDRVDIAVPDVPNPLLVECKAYKITRQHLPQAERYLASARAKWPDGDPLVVLAAPDRDESIVPPHGIMVVRVQAVGW